MRVNSELYQSTLKIYQYMTLNQSQDHENWFNLGLSFFRLSAYNKAIECFKNAKKPKSLNTEIWYNIGLAYLELKNYQKATYFFEKVIEIHPEGEKAWKNLISRFVETQDHIRAKKSMRVINAFRTKLENSLKYILKKIMMAEPGIKTVILTDGSGVVISQISKNSLSPIKLNEIGATSSAIIRAMKVFGHNVYYNGFELILAEFDNAKVYYIPTSFNKVITVIADRDVCLGLIRLIMKSAGSKLAKILLELAISE